MKLDGSLVYWRRTPNHSKKTDGNVKHTGIEQNSQKNTNLQKERERRNKKMNNVSGRFDQHTELLLQILLAPGEFRNTAAPEEKCAICQIKYPEWKDNQWCKRTKSFTEFQNGAAPENRILLRKQPEMLAIELNDTSYTPNWPEKK
jgi:hypothetical protein